jgi:hypothetical protein
MRRKEILLSDVRPRDGLYGIRFYGWKSNDGSSHIKRIESYELEDDVNEDQKEKEDKIRS